MHTKSDRSDVHLALAGMIALAVAMGIGRFSFTPLLPLMQADMGLTLAQGGWLASANYLGYLVGAVVAIRSGPSPSALMRGGLMLVVATTALMAFVSSPMLWSAARFVAGVASAWVLVGTAALSLGRLAQTARSKLSGVVFAGVGFGMTVAGLLCHGLSVAGWDSRSGWWALALVAGVGAVFAWHGATERPRAETGQSARAAAGGARSLKSPTSAAVVEADRVDPTRSGKSGGLLVFCYGLFGFGYILPATFLPAQARALMPDPAVFGWVWPVFGFAAMASTLVAASRGSAYSRRTWWAVAQVVMAVGVILPVVWGALAALVLAAICVGGTFMVITMLGMQEARAVAGVDAQRLMAAMTAAFATGQLFGPLVVSAIGGVGWPIDVALTLAAAGLVTSTLLLGFFSRSTLDAQEEGV
ncbi:MAG TPA: YbfB/YjiJ family MFS transporter [Rhodocyclaceae bacterium]|nr:YbfB/YjiJ family MFS transporter [Rhodocyclaceae bacterium]HRQ46051.1 YbfB/YjiJ family MFS transporter [Rhodocyclaceae bacterium]